MRPPKITGEYCSNLQLPLKYRKQFCARALLSYRFNSLDYDEVISDTESLEQVFLSGIEETKNSFSLRDNIPLDEFLDDVTKAIKRNYNDVSDGLKKLIDDVSCDFKKIRCGTCGEKEGISEDTICVGKGRSDAELVALGGACLSNIREFFEFAIKVTEEIYATCANGFLNAPPIRVILATQVTFEPECNAATTFPANYQPGQRQANVLLDIPADHFSFSLFASLPYIILHEIFVHSLQSLLAHNKAYTYSAYCRFTEGLLDALACEHFCRLLENGPVGSKILATKPIEFRDEARSFQFQRRNPNPPGKRSDGRDESRFKRRIVHTHGYILLQKWLSLDQHFAKRWGPEWPYKLALSLNIADLDQRQRNDIWILIKGYFDTVNDSDPKIGRNPLIVDKAHRAIKRFICENDINLLINTSIEWKLNKLLKDNDFSASKTPPESFSPTRYDPVSKKLLTFDPE